MHLHFFLAHQTFLKNLIEYSLANARCKRTHASSSYEVCNCECYGSHTGTITIDLHRVRPNFADKNLFTKRRFLVEKLEANSQ